MQDCRSFQTMFGEHACPTVNGISDCQNIIVLPSNILAEQDQYETFTNAQHNNITKINCFDVIVPLNHSNFICLVSSIQIQSKA